MRTYSSLIIGRSLITGLAAALISTAALAANTTATTTSTTNKPTKEVVKIGSPAQLADRCAALVVQFDSAIMTHGNAAKVNAAKSLRTSGEQECKSGHATTGIQSLTQALKDLGVKAQA